MDVRQPGVAMTVRAQSTLTTAAALRMATMALRAHAHQPGPLEPRLLHQTASPSAPRPRRTVEAAPVICRHGVLGPRRQDTVCQHPRQALPTHGLPATHRVLLTLPRLEQVSVRPHRQLSTRPLLARTMHLPPVLSTHPLLEPGRVVGETVRLRLDRQQRPLLELVEDTTQRLLQGPMVRQRHLLLDRGIRTMTEGVWRRNDSLQNWEGRVCAAIGVEFCSCFAFLFNGPDLLPGLSWL